MPVYLEDPSVLTKDKLKSELLANSVELPSGNPTKDVYVQLYLQNLTSQNQKRDTTWDAFSSDEELPPPVVSNRSRSSGKKASKKTDKVEPENLDLTTLTDDGLREELINQGLDVGPIVASTRKVYEKKLQKLLDNGDVPPPQPEVVAAEIQGNLNGHSEADQYSDKEDELIVEPEPELKLELQPEPEPEPEPEPVPVEEPEPEPEPEPVPVVERLLRSRGKTPVSSRSSSRSSITQHQMVEKITASDQSSKVVETEVLKELFPNDTNSPSGLSITCRRPIRGAAGRPLKPLDLWSPENGAFSPKFTKTSSSSSTYTESRFTNRVTSLPLSSAPAPPTAAPTRLLSAAPPAAQTKAAGRGLSLWIKLLLLAVVAAFLFLVFQAMETNVISPFEGQDKEVAAAAE